MLLIFAVNLRSVTVMTMQLFLFWISCIPNNWRYWMCWGKKNYSLGHQTLLASELCGEYDDSCSLHTIRCLLPCSFIFFPIQSLVWSEFTHTCCQASCHWPVNISLYFLISLLVTLIFVNYWLLPLYTSIFSLTFQRQKKAINKGKTLVII